MIVSSVVVATVIGLGEQTETRWRWSRFPSRGCIWSTDRIEVKAGAAEVG